jgi:molybdate transport system substrate-binding protein
LPQAGDPAGLKASDVSARIRRRRIHRDTSKAIKSGETKMRRLLAVALVLGLIVTSSLAYAGDTIVFAAASTKDVITDIIAAYAKAHSGHIVPSFGSSGDLAKQIENGAPASIFISADVKWMDYVAKAKLIDADSRRNLLGNELVLIAPVNSTAPTSLDNLAAGLNGGKLAMGDPDSVPAGRYGKAALDSMKQWSAVEGSVVRAKDVRAAMAFVERGEAAAGIVYATDALVSQKVRIAATFPEASHPPIVYPVALVAGHDDAAARDFFAYLAGPEAREIFLSAGFTVIGAGAATN